MFSTIKLTQESKYYELYRKEMIKCTFCGKLNNLHYIKSHLKTESCKQFQTILDKSDYIKQLVDFMRIINELKSNIRLNLNTDESDEENEIIK